MTQQLLFALKFFLCNFPCTMENSKSNHRNNCIHGGKEQTVILFEPRNATMKLFKETTTDAETARKSSNKK